MDVKVEYFEWLCDRVNIDRDYIFLMKALHRKDFIWLIDLDENRAGDGKRLRDKFIEAYDLNAYEELEGPCSLLEMLVALADRLEFIMTGIVKESSTPYWFWMFLENLDLLKYTNEVFIEDENYLIINDILDRFVERRYQRNGKFGLFPLNHPNKDQRKVEIWYQMHAFLDENYHDKFREEFL